MDADVIHNYMRQKKVDDRNIEKLKRIFKIAAYLLSLVNYLSLHERQEIEEKADMTAFLMKGVGKILLPIVVNEEWMKEAEREEG